MKHHPSCALGTGGNCSCRPGERRYMASVYDARYVDPATGVRGKRTRKTFANLAEAKAWRVDAQSDYRANRRRAPSSVKLREAAEDMLRRMELGAIRTRSGDRYKPSAIRGIREALALRILPPLGAHKLGDVSRGDVQLMVGDWQAAGLSASTIRNTINALRVLYRHADDLGGTQGTLNPTLGLKLPAVRSRRDRVVSPAEAQQMLDLLAAEDRALWAVAFYAGLRSGELQALRWEDVDLAAGLVGVERSWDPKAGPVAPKSRAGSRKVPMAPQLRDYLAEHKVATGRAIGLVFGADGVAPFRPAGPAERANRLWTAAGFERLTLHDARHTCASFLIAAGVHMKAISTYLGHASILVTMDVYGHLLPGDESEHADQLGAFLVRSDSAGRIAQIA